jgi:carboxymethylenebutenolidase
MDALDDRRCPVLAMFAELDAYVSIDYVEELRKRADRNPLELEIVVYPGLHHGFAHRGREHFDAPAHDDGWQRIWKLFEQQLRAN